MASIDLRAADHLERAARRSVSHMVKARARYYMRCPMALDLLHPGHVHLLEQCRAMCDRLIVGLNADASVKRLKGPSRPVRSEAERAAVLASVAAVDLVCIFEEDTPLNLLGLIKPDLLVKGADYTHATVVGAREVEGWGGRVALAELLPGHSTTATLARLRG